MIPDMVFIKSCSRLKVVFMNPSSIAFLTVMLCLAGAGQAQIAGSQKEASTKLAAARAKNSAPSIDTSNWKSYRDEKHGFELKYPEMWRVNAGSGTGANIIAISKPRRGAESNASLTLAIQKNQNPK